jgi:glycosyltransferase involved in cell wall biosynthesis
MNSPLFITIIIPTYNRASTISRAIQSVLNQTYTHYQLIVVDDGSEDNTREVIMDFPQVAYYYKTNGGQASARNHGLQYAKGDFIASLDSDDEWLPNYLEHQVNAIQQHQLDVAFTNWYQASPEFGVYPFLNNFKYVRDLYAPALNNSYYIFDYATFRERYIKVCICPSSGVIIRKSIMTKGWNNRMHIGDDWFLMLDLITQYTIQCGFTFNPLWKKNVNDDNVFDGRDMFEIYKYLYFDDIDTMLRELHPHLSKAEKYTLKNHKFKAVRAMYKVARPKKSFHYHAVSLQYLGKTFVQHPIGFLKYILQYL